MQDHESKTAQIIALAAAFLIGILGGAWLLFDTTPATQNVDKPSTTSTEVEKLKLENQLLVAELEKQKLQQQLAAFEQPTAATSTERVAASPGKRTLNFWNQMNSIIDREAAMRAVPPEGVNDSNAATFMIARIEAGEFAVESLNEMNAHSVDSQVIGLKQKLVKWYADGVNVCQTGQKILNADTATRRSAAGLKWKASEFAHSAAVNAVNTTGKAVRKSMNQKYGLDFPPLK